MVSVDVRVELGHVEAVEDVEQLLPNTVLQQFHIHGLVARNLHITSTDSVRVANVEFSIAELELELQLELKLELELELKLELKLELS